jgi:hypothetical protein
MTFSATVCLVIVWSIIAGATLYCFGKLLTSPRRFDASAD